MEPTIDDAVRLLMDPQNVAMGGLAGGGMVEVSLAGVLQKLEMSDQGRARELVRLAVERLNGKWLVGRLPQTGLRSGQAVQRYRTTVTVLIPRDAFDEPRG